MTTSPLCPQCGKPLPGDAPQGLCAECLFKAALASQTSSAATGAFHETPASTTINPEAGVRLQYFGDYELLEEIARGGMGVVWKARQTSLRREVAVKMIRAGALASTDEVQRFLREAEAAANLQHPNIVAIHEVGEHGGQHYFSMDYVAGRDLGALVRTGPLPAQRAARYVKIIAEAIHFAHQRGTLHRDLKPQNVLIDEADQPRITDFGLAKIVDHDSRLTQTGVVMGSPSYMPPEQAAGRHADIGPHSDVYALGAMLYELLTGRPPFGAATAVATLRQVLDADPVPPRRLQADIPRDLETICLKCLEKMPAARYASARALAEELGRFLQGEPILARPAGTLRKAVSWSRRHPGVLAAAATLLAIALAFGSFYLIEENALLRAQQADPALVRTAGPRSEAVQTWDTINLLVMFTGIYTQVWLVLRARRCSWKDLFDPAQAMRPLEPVGEGVRTFAACIALGCAGSGFLLLIKMIQAHVWEGVAPSSGNYFGVFASVWWGLFLMSHVLRDYRITHFGLPSRQLAPDQLAPIRRALEQFDLPAAIRLYRQGVPDAGVAEANDYCMRLAETLRTQHPGKFGPPPLSLATLNWPALILCAVIEGVVGSVAWLAFPPAAPEVVLCHLSTGLLFMAGIFAGLRVKGFGKRMLLLVPALVFTVVTEAVAPRSSDGTGTRVFWPYLLGIVFGMFLMLSAFTPRRRPYLQKQ